MKPVVDSEENRSSWVSSMPSCTSKASILYVMWGIVAVAVAVIVAAVFFVFHARQGTVSSGPAVTTSSAEPVLFEFEKLKGKWLRPDGGYVLEIKRLLPQNELEAAYFNPNPISLLTPMVE